MQKKKGKASRDGKEEKAEEEVRESVGEEEKGDRDKRLISIHFGSVLYNLYRVRS